MLNVTIKSFIIDVFCLFHFKYPFYKLKNTDMMMDVLKMLMSISLILSTSLIIWKVIMRMNGNLPLKC